MNKKLYKLSTECPWHEDDAWLRCFSCLRAPVPCTYVRPFVTHLDHQGVCKTSPYLCIRFGPYLFDWSSLCDYTYVKRTILFWLWFLIYCHSLPEGSVWSDCIRFDETSILASSVYTFERSISVPEYDSVINIVCTFVNLLTILSER